MYTFSTFRLDVAERRLFNGAASVTLRRKAFELLVVLVKADGRLKTRQELIDALWPETLVVEHNLTTVVSELRRALGDEDKTPRFIETVRGYGYRLIPPVQSEAPDEGLQTHVEDRDDVTFGSKPGHPSHEGEVSSLKPPRGTREPVALNGSESRAHRFFKNHRTTITFVLVVIAAGAGFLGWRYSRSRASAPVQRGDIVRTPASKSIAVLPFITLGSKKADAYFAVGLQEMILTKLADISKLKVIAQSSTSGYGGRPKNLATIAHHLGVRTVLEGSVQKDANRIRVNVELLDPFTHITIWAGSYTRKLNDVFKLQSVISGSIVAALKLHLMPGIIRRIQSLPTKSAEAYDFFLKGEYQHRLSTSTGSAAALEQSILDYRQAIRRDPNFALAYAQLSDALMDSYVYGYDRVARQLEAANAAANQALAIEPKLAEAHAAKGNWYYLGKHKLVQARKQLNEALSLKPQEPSVLLSLGAIDRHEGNWDSAVRKFSRAVQLDPRNTLALRNLAVTESALRHYSVAISLEKRAVSMNPDDAIDLAFLASYYADDGEVEQALETLRSAPKGIRQNPYVAVIYLQSLILGHYFDKARAEANKLHPGGQLKSWYMLSYKAKALWDDGYRHQARKEYARVVKILHKALKKEPGNSQMHAFLGLAYIHLGNSAAAISEGRRAVNLLPLKSRPLIGPAPLENLAEIYALSGKSGKAIAILHKLMSIPAGAALSIALLNKEPVWAAIRSAPEFVALLSDEANLKGKIAEEH